MFIKLFSIIQTLRNNLYITGRAVFFHIMQDHLLQMRILFERRVSFVSMLRIESHFSWEI